MNFTLHQLLIFNKIVETGSITKAAEELHLTQPAVSIQLKRLQEQFDEPLTEIVGRKLYITPFGTKLAESAQNILREARLLSEKSKTTKGQLQGLLRISVVSTAKYIVPYFLIDFIRQHPYIDLKVDVTNKASVIESIEHNTVDFSMVTILPEHLQINNIALMANKLVLVAGRDQPFPENDSPSLFEKIPFIYREQGSGTRLVTERYFMAHQLAVNRKLELMGNEAVKQAIIAGLGYSLMPLIGMKNEILGGELKIVPVKGLPIQSTWHLIWHKRKNLTPVAQEFLNHINQNKDTITDKYFGWINGFKVK